jgi:hypothetical protein
MSKAATLAPVEHKHDCATHQRFVGGPFDGRTYREKLSMPECAPEGTWAISIPHGVGFVDGLIWRQVAVVCTNFPSPSEPSRYVNYSNGKDGCWEYVPWKPR